jgi:signal transduction histidine kinase
MPTSLDRRERTWQAAFAVLPYVMLAVANVLTLLLAPVQPLSLLPILGLSAFLAVWLLWLYTLHPAWRERPAVMAVFFTVLIAVTASLVVVDPWFGFFSFTCYFFAPSLSGRWRFAGLFAVALITATSQNGGLPKHTAAAVAIYTVIVLVNVGVGGGFNYFGWVSQEQDAWRERAMAELAEANRQLEATLAENAGLHKQLLAQAREAGILDERQRLAREIHDTLAQGLTGIITQLEAAAQPGKPAAERNRHRAAAMRLARESLSEARRSVHALRPEPLDRARLPEALAEVSRRWTDLHQIPVQLVTTGQVCPVGPEVELALLRTAQEALANVAKHARAGRAGLTLSYLGDEIALDVRDDGTGFEPGRTGHPGRPGGFGLTAMRQRVEALSGTLDIESEPGGGTAISARISLPAAPSVPDAALTPPGPASLSPSSAPASLAASAPGSPALPAPSATPEWPATSTPSAAPTASATPAPLPTAGA